MLSNRKRKREGHVTRTNHTYTKKSPGRRKYNETKSVTFLENEYDEKGNGIYLRLTNRIKKYIILGIFFFFFCCKHPLIS